jgi:hypothetical protein
MASKRYICKSTRNIQSVKNLKIDMIQKLIIFSIFSLGLIGFVTCSYAVQDNVTIEGNLDPTNRSEELYVVSVTPSNEHRDITFSIYGSGEVIFSKTSKRAAVKRIFL